MVFIFSGKGRARHSVLAVVQPRGASCGAHGVTRPAANVCANAVCFDLEQKFDTKSAKTRRPLLANARRHFWIVLELAR